MVLIGSFFQPARSRKQPDKAGRVYLRLIFRKGSHDGASKRVVRSLGTDIMAVDRTDAAKRVEALLPYIRIAYLLIEKCHNDGCLKPDDVVARYHLALQGDVAFKEIVDRSTKDFSFRADIVRLGAELKKHIRLVYPEKIAADSDNLMEYISRQELKLRNEGKMSAVNSYASTRNSLTRFINGDYLPFGSVDKHFIAQYSDWLGASGMAASTQSFYLRKLRAILNHAAEEGLMGNTDNFFKGLNTRVQYEKEKTDCGDFGMDDLRRIAALDLTYDRELSQARDLFMFAYYCRGMELREVVSLTKANVRHGVLTYQRRMMGRRQQVVLEKAAWDIIMKYSEASQVYLFPIKETYEGRTQSALSQRVNARLKKIGSLTGVPNLSFSMNVAVWERMFETLKATTILSIAQ